MFHFNWGWNGLCDGFFNIDLLNPSDEASSIHHNYSNRQSMVYNICPPAAVDDKERSKIVVQNITCDKKSYERSTPNLPFNFNVSALLAGDVQSKTSLQIGFALCDDKGIVKLLAPESLEINSNDDEFNYRDNLYLQNDVPNGKYKLIVVNRINDNDEWLPALKSQLRHIDVTVSDFKLSLNPINNGTDLEEYINFGSLTVDGISYALTSEYNIFKAYVLPSETGAVYSGNINIPDFIENGSYKFKVFEETGEPFSNSNITSISTPIALNLSNCSQLTNIEYRDGVLSTEILDNCSYLQTISYSSSCRKVSPITNCPSLKSLRFQNLYPSAIFVEDDTQSWTLNSIPSLTDIYLYGDEPPTFGYLDAFENSNINIHIPSGLKELYSAFGMQNLNLIEDLDKIPESVKWDYCGLDEDANDVLKGSETGKYIEFAVQIPSDESEKYKGNKIAAIEYYTPQLSAELNESGSPDYIFITKGDNDYAVKMSTTPVRGSWTRVYLDIPYEIDNEDIFIGVGKYENLFFTFANLNTYGGGFWYRELAINPSTNLLSGEWEHNCGDPDWNNPMPIRAIIQGDNLPSDIAIIEAEYKPGEKPLSDSGDINLKILNRSPRMAKNVTLNLDFDGKFNQIANTTVNLPMNHDAIIKINPDSIRFNTRVINIDAKEIDGNSDAIASDSHYSIELLPASSDFYPRATVIEEKADINDGKYVSGIATKEAMKIKYGDNVIPISIHADEKMDVKDSSYQYFLNNVKSSDKIVYNYNHINRKIWETSIPFNIEDIIGSAYIKTEAIFTKEGRIGIISKSSFSYNHDENEAINIAYVLLEDNVGPYDQKNGFSKVTGVFDYLKWWATQDSSVKYTFDDVARTIHIYSGFENIFPSNIIKHEVYDAQYLMKIPSYVVNSKNLKVVTLLIDKQSGEILNADCCQIDGQAPDISIKPGDSDGDGNIDIVDAVNIANFVLAKDFENFNYTAADVNNDGNLTFADAAATVSLILEQSADYDSDAMRIRSKAQEGTDGVLFIDGIPQSNGTYKTLSLSLGGDSDFVALQADLIMPSGRDLNSVKFATALEDSHKLSYSVIDDHTVRVILYDFNNRLIDKSKQPMIEVTFDDMLEPGEIELRNIIASDAKANKHLLSSLDNTCIVNNINDLDKTKKIEINLDGNILEIRNALNRNILISTYDGKLIKSISSPSEFEKIELPSGLYIVKVGNEAEKVMVK